MWAPGRGILERDAFPAIQTFDSSRTPKRGERPAAPGTLAAVDLTAIVAALAAAEAESLPRTRSGDPGQPKENRARQAQLKRELTATQARIEILERDDRELGLRLERIAVFAAGPATAPGDAAPEKAPAADKIRERPAPPMQVASPRAASVSGDGEHPAAKKLLAAAAQHAPERFTWGQVATLAGLKPSGGHFNAGRKILRDASYVAEVNDLVTASPAGLKAAGEVPRARRHRPSGWPCDAIVCRRRRPRCCEPSPQKASAI